MLGAVPAHSRQALLDAVAYCGGAQRQRDDGLWSAKAHVAHIHPGQQRPPACTHVLSSQMWEWQRREETVGKQPAGA